MKLRLKKNSKKLVEIKASQCFNCGHPFINNEKFCPECGQKNKNPKITFGNFVHEVFNGFISWDSKFWTTFIPLLTKPGKVSKDYIDGKRQRYANPFRFYLTISVLFFLMLGISNSFNELGYLNGSKGKSTSFIKIDPGTAKVANLDSINIGKITEEGVDIALKNMDSTERKKLLKEVPQLKKDSIVNSINEQVLKNKFMRFRAFSKKHPNSSINDALDSLKYPKTFINRFYYDRMLKFKDFNQEKDLNEVAKKGISYISISLFVLLPIFALALKFFYMRRKFTYVEHLVFIFHTQTVFFLLLIIFFPLSYYQDPDVLIPVFLILFLIYLFIAMKKFYNQGFFKTLLKFIIINNIYMFLGGIGMFIILLISFAFY